MGTLIVVSGRGYDELYLFREWEKQTLNFKSDLMTLNNFLYKCLLVYVNLAHVTQLLI